MFGERRAADSEEEELVDLSNCVRKIHPLGKYYVAWLGAGMRFAPISRTYNSLYLSLIFVSCGNIPFSQVRRRFGVLTILPTNHSMSFSTKKLL